MTDVRQRQPWHVATNAIIRRLSLPPFCRRHGTALRDVAGKTPLPVEGGSTVALRLRMRIVAGDASQTPFTGSPTAAQVQLVEVTERLKAGAFHRRGNGENGHHVIQRCAGPEIRVSGSRPRHTSVAGQVALVAEVVAQPVIQLRRIHNRPIDRIRQRVARTPLSDVNLSRPVATLALYGGGSRPGLPELVGSSGDEL